MAKERKDNRKTFLFTDSGLRILNWLKYPLRVSTDVDVATHAIATTADIASKMKDGAVVKYHYPDGRVEDFVPTWEVELEVETPYEAITAFREKHCPRTKR